MAHRRNQSEEIHSGHLGGTSYEQGHPCNLQGDLTSAVVEELGPVAYRAWHTKQAVVPENCFAVGECFQPGSGYVTASISLPPVGSRPHPSGAQHRFALSSHQPKHFAAARLPAHSPSP
jgi:hypothetical protein